MIEDRVLKEANYVVKYKATIRETARYFGISKSTVHLDLSKRLSRLDNCLFNEVKEILDYNFSVRYIRGGESTKRKYQNIKINL